MLDLNCTICNEVYSISDEVYVIKCGHMFHNQCLHQWLLRSKTCPQCRMKCTLRNIFKVYLNSANLDVPQPIDGSALQEQLKAAQDKVEKLQVEQIESLNEIHSLREQLKNAEEKAKNLEGYQRKSRKKIIALEQLALLYIESSQTLKTEAESLKHEEENFLEQLNATNFF